MLKYYSQILSLALVVSFLALQTAGQKPVQNTVGKKQNSAAYPFPFPYPYPFPPHPNPNPTTPCDVCPKIHRWQLCIYRTNTSWKVLRQRLDAGFLVSKTRLESLCQKAVDILGDLGGPCPPSTTSNIQVVVSSPTNNNDNTETIVNCPTGTILINCRCTSEGAACDGVSVTGNKRGCKARNGPGGGSVRAIGTCSPLGDGFTIISGSPSSDPKLSCAAGGTIADCWIENRNPQNGLIKTKINNDGSECSTTGTCGTGGQGCSLTVLCTVVAQNSFTG